MVKGVKAFKKGLICRGHQFKEGETFSVNGNPKACRNGYHFCENPLDTLEYYPLIDDNGDVSEFAAVEALGDIDRDGNKVATNKIHIGAKLGLPGFIKASFDFLWEKCWNDPNKVTPSEGDADGYGARLASSGDSARLASSGYGAQLASSGDSARLASSGDSAQLASSGDSAQLASSGYGAQLASSGYGAQLASSGDSAQLASSGYGAQLASSGYGAQLASSGDSARLALKGESSVGAAIGVDSRIRGQIGNWITLAEWTWNRNLGRYEPVCVKSAQIDGETLKPDTWYELRNGEFVGVSS
ncbi:DUF7666 domain-containing protein [Paenibacillus paeoniae]|uniref:DUF7666 domain-containing protein n=1 Tax=Paenibacillus paeoniae TaxID=2292705 RepID=A0A371P063_9BACL|nr:hypothetical protein [Paenibacillus paeoniae]REK69314.1 hypothetical protein DX130_24440 [Paenibacillus paeoniae]